MDDDDDLIKGADDQRRHFMSTYRRIGSWVVAGTDPVNICPRCRLMYDPLEFSTCPGCVELSLHPHATEAQFWEALDVVIPKLRSHYRVH